MTHERHGQAASQLAETLTGADRGVVVKPNRVFVVIIFSVIVLLVGGGSSQCGTPPPLKEQHIEDPGSKALSNFYQALYRTEQARFEDSAMTATTRIFHYGDSHVAADILTGSLRRAFAQGFGSAGPGFLPAGKPYVWFHRAGVNIETSSGWRVEGIGNQIAGAFGLSGISFIANRTGEDIQLSANANRFTIFLHKQPNGGAIEISIDGEVRFSHVSLDSNKTDDLVDTPTETVTNDEDALYLEINADSLLPHKLEIRTLNSGLVRVVGIAAEQDVSGVTYDAFGINGARATRALFWDWHLMQSNLSYRTPDLIIIAYGSNEVGDADLDLDEYQKQFAELLNRFHEAAPNASLLVIAPPDRAAFNKSTHRWESFSRMPALVEAQRRAAFRSGAAFWNLYRAMGGMGSIAQWAVRKEPLAQRDRVHLTTEGYKAVAESLYGELKRGYIESQK